MQANQEDRIAPQPKSSGTNYMAIVAVILALAAATYFYFTRENPDAIIEQSVAEVNVPEQAPSEPLAVDQIPETEPVTAPEEVVAETVVTEPEVAVKKPEPLPTLNDSDPFMLQKSNEIAGEMVIEPLLVKHDIARQFVVFVDNLAQGDLARKVSPITGPKTQFNAVDVTNKTYMDPDSFHRYDMYADFLAGLNDKQLAATYKQVEPLLQQAFDELGYANKNFNDTMQDAIQVMLDAPIITDPIELNGISVNYQFTDPKLEALPSAQKLMIRMGPENSKKVKAVLRKLQAQLQQ